MEKLRLQSGDRVLFPPGGYPTPFGTCLDCGTVVVPFIERRVVPWPFGKAEPCAVISRGRTDRIVPHRWIVRRGAGIGDL